MTSSLRIKIIVNFFAILLASLSADAAEIVLKAKHTADRSIIRVGDVAEVRGDTRQQESQLRQLPLFPAPGEGRVRTLHLRELRELLVLHNIAVDKIKFSGERLVRVDLKPQAVLQPASRSAPKAEAGFVVAIRPLTRGDIIRASDVVVRPLLQTPTRINPATRLSDVVGHEVLRTIALGQPVDRRQLQKPVLIRRGQAVQVKAKAAGVVVTTTARAAEDGSLGDIILLQSLDSREKYSAHVTGLQTAEIYVSGIRAVDPTPTITRRPTQLKTPDRDSTIRR